MPGSRERGEESGLSPAVKLGNTGWEQCSSVVNRDGSASTEVSPQRDKQAGNTPWGPPSNWAAKEQGREVRKVWARRSLVQGSSLLKVAMPWGEDGFTSSEPSSHMKRASQVRMRWQPACKGHPGSSSCSGIRGRAGQLSGLALHWFPLPSWVPPPSGSCLEGHPPGCSWLAPSHHLGLSSFVKDLPWPASLRVPSRPAPNSSSLHSFFFPSYHLPQAERIFIYCLSPSFNLT